MATKKSKSKKTAKKHPVGQSARRGTVHHEQATRSERSTRGKNQAHAKDDRLRTPADEHEELETRSGGQSGSLQGLSNVSKADSETVDELLEEGNAFEAGVIKGVEDAPDADQGEVRTHEVSEDDVPEEYWNEEDQ